MKAAVRRRFEMATRVRDFLRDHKMEGLEAALTRLEQLVDRAHQLTTQQLTGVVAARGSTEHRAKVRRSLQTKLLRCLAAVGVAAARENVGLGAFFRLPTRHVPTQVFEALAQAMLAKATEHKDLLIRQGLSESVLADTATALAQFEETLEQSRASRRAHVGASSDMQAVATEISEQVRLLDGLVAYRFADNTELTAAWASARNVEGPFRSRDEADAGTGETPGVVKAA